MVGIQADKPGYFSAWQNLFEKRYEQGSLPLGLYHFPGKGPVSIGNLFDFLRLTERQVLRVFYLGDHRYEDMADLMLWPGRHPGALLSELEREICIINIQQ